MQWIKNFPHEVDFQLKHRLSSAFCRCFSINEAELINNLLGREGWNGTGLPTAPESSESKLHNILPKGGWFEWYEAYTSKVEGPLSYHIFSSICLLGACLGRNIWVDMGFFRVFPNCAIVLIGPPGIKKTTATDIARSLVERVGACPVLPDKLPPERMITKLKESGHQFLYAPEFSVFFGRQKYLEGLSTQILRMLDSPDKFTVSTGIRGDEELFQLAISVLGATTPSLLAGSTPSEVTSSGFLSRFILVYEAGDTRVFSRPSKGPYEDKILRTLERIKSYAGEMTFRPEADAWHEVWYYEYRKRISQVDDITAEAQARTQTHMIRLAMLIHLVQCDNLRICLDCLQIASRLMEFIQSSSPQIIKTFRQSTISQDGEYLYETLRRMGGAGNHSKLLRRVASRMNATQFKQHIRTLEEAGRLTTEKLGAGTFYVLTGVDPNDANN